MFVGQFVEDQFSFLDLFARDICIMNSQLYVIIWDLLYACCLISRQVKYYLLLPAKVLTSLSPLLIPLLPFLLPAANIKGSEASLQVFISLVCLSSSFSHSFKFLLLTSSPLTSPLLFLDSSLKWL